MSEIHLPARSLIVAPRLPAFPAHHTGNPFTSSGDIVVDCDVAGCGWHAFGPRADMKLAVNDHHRRFHPEQTGVVLLNQPQQ